MLRLAIERAIEIVGEAASRVSSQFRDEHPEIPWRDIVGQRNILIHQYGRIDASRLWHTATQDIPQLVDAIDRIIPREAGPT